MEVIWSEFAERQLDDIFTYYSENASIRMAKKLITGLINEPEKLIHNHFTGQVEPLLQERKELYRYLVYKNYKIIYSVNPQNRFIKIADVFDARQNPKKNKKNQINNLIENPYGCFSKAYSNPSPSTTFRQSTTLKF